MKIKSITPAGKADVFNMEVEETHDFAVGDAGAIVHNCYDEWRYICMARPITPREKRATKEWTPPPDDPLDQRTGNNRYREPYEYIELF